MRLPFILTIILGTGHVWAQAPVPCEFERPIELRLESHEFSIPVYDAVRGLMVVQLRRELMPNMNRAASIHLEMPQRELVLPIIPTSVSLGLERGVRQLQVIIEAEPINRNPSPMDARPNCNDLKLRAVRLEQDSVVLTRHTVVDRSGIGQRKLEVQQGIRIARGHIDAVAIESVVHGLAKGCLERSLVDQSRVHGALSIRLARSLMGEPEKPTIAVDGLVNRQIGYCLIASLVDSKKVWTALQPASTIFLDLYFRGEVRTSVEQPVHHVEAERSFH